MEQLTKIARKSSTYDRIKLKVAVAVGMELRLSLSKNTPSILLGGRGTRSKEGGGLAGGGMTSIVLCPPLNWKPCPPSNRTNRTNRTRQLELMP